MGISLLKRASLFSLVLLCCVNASWAIGGDGLYFIQTFEDLTTFPETKPATEVAFNVDGQGEWLYLGAFQATNADYIPDGSEHNLRMPKSGSYVITPLFSNGVSRVTFDIGRSSVKVYTSADGGSTWTEAEQSITGKKVMVTVNSDVVNRIKIANDASKDADINAHNAMMNTVLGLLAKGNMNCAGGEMDASSDLFGEKKAPASTMDIHRDPRNPNELAPGIVLTEAEKQKAEEEKRKAEEAEEEKRRAEEEAAAEAIRIAAEEEQRRKKDGSKIKKTGNKILDFLKGLVQEPEE